MIQICGLPFLFLKFTDTDFTSRATIIIPSYSTGTCIDFTNVVIDDNVGLEGNENFTILVGDSMAMVTIIDDDG